MLKEDDHGDVLNEMYTTSKLKRIYALLKTTLIRSHDWWMLSYTANSLVWKIFDNRHLDFVLDIYNIRLDLATNILIYFG